MMQIDHNTKENAQKEVLTKYVLVIIQFHVVIIVICRAMLLEASINRTNTSQLE